MPVAIAGACATRRNKGFEGIHREMIETAVQLISHAGSVNRTRDAHRSTTVYYHFESREDLLDAVKY